MRGLSRNTSSLELNSEIGDDSHAAAAAAALSDDSLMQADKHRILREVDEFVTEYELHSIRSVMRNGAMWFYHPHDLAQIESDMPYLGDQTEQDDQRGPGRGRSLYAIYASTVLMGIQIIGSVDHIVLFEPVIERDYDNPDEWSSGYPKGFWRSFSLATIGPLTSAIIGYLISLYMNRCLGRRLAIRQLSIFTPIASLGLYLPLGREILSISSILMLALSVSTWSTIYLYAFEMVEPSKRKSTMLKLLLSQFLVSLPSCIAEVIDNSLGKFCVTTCASVVIFILSSKMADSPYWLVQSGDVKSAYKSLRDSRSTSLIACRDLYQIYIKNKQHRSQHAEQFGYRNHPRAIEAFTNSRVRPIFATCIAVSLSLEYSLFSSLIDGTEFSDGTWKTASIQQFMSILILCLIGAVLLSVILKVDRVGRRPISIGLMTLVLIFTLVPFVFPWHSWGFDSKTPRTISDVGVFTLIIPARVPLFLYLWEAFPLLYREIGGSLMASVGTAFLGIQTIWKKMVTEIYLPDNKVPLFPMLIISPIAILLTWFYMEETSKLPLEYFGESLKASPPGMKRYRLFVYLPYIFKRHVLREDTILETFEESRYHRGAIYLNDENIEALQDQRWSLDS